MANITIHHEGAGRPDDDFKQLQTARYSGSVGLTQWRLVRSPAESFVTSGQGGRTLQVCFSGDRNVWPITDSDLVLLSALVSEARARGWVGQTPTVRFHKDTEPTACPGQLTERRRAEIVAACQAQPPAVSVTKGTEVVLPVRWPPAKVGRFPVPFYSHNDDHILAFNGAAVGGDIAAFGIRVLRVPVVAGARLIGLSYGVNPDGTDNVRKVVAYASNGAVYVYDAT